MENPKAALDLLMHILEYSPRQSTQANNGELGQNAQEQSNVASRSSFIPPRHEAGGTCCTALLGGAALGNAPPTPCTVPGRMDMCTCPESPSIGPISHSAPTSPAPGATLLRQLEAMRYLTELRAGLHCEPPSPALRANSCHLPLSTPTSPALQVPMARYLGSMGTQVPSGHTTQGTDVVHRQADLSSWLEESALGQHAGHQTEGLQGPLAQQQTVPLAAELMPKDAGEKELRHTKSLPERRQSNEHAWGWVTALKAVARGTQAHGAGTSSQAHPRSHPHPRTHDSRAQENQEPALSPQEEEKQSGFGSVDRERSGSGDSLLLQLEHAVQELAKAPECQREIGQDTAEGGHLETQQPHMQQGQVEIAKQMSKHMGHFNGICAVECIKTARSAEKEPGSGEECGEVNLNEHRDIVRHADTESHPAAASAGNQRCTIRVPESPNSATDVWSFWLNSNRTLEPDQLDKLDTEDGQEASPTAKLLGPAPNRKKIMKERQRRSSIRQNIKRLRSALPRDIADEVPMDTASIIDAAVKYILRLTGSEDI